MDNDLPPEPISGDIFVLAGLSVKDVEYLSMHYFDCRSYAEIGAYYGVTKQSVYDVIKRCLRNLKKAGVPLPKQMCNKEQKVKTFYMDSYMMDHVFEGTTPEDEGTDNEDYD